MNVTQHSVSADKILNHRKVCMHRRFAAECCIFHPSVPFATGRCLDRLNGPGGTCRLQSARIR